MTVDNRAVQMSFGDVMPGLASNAAGWPDGWRSWRYTLAEARLRQGGGQRGRRN
jgi:hypothetical protein